MLGEENGKAHHIVLKKKNGTKNEWICARTSMLFVSDSSGYLMQADFPYRPDDVSGSKRKM